MTFSLHINTFQKICKEGTSHVANRTLDIHHMYMHMYMDMYILDADRTAAHLDNTCGQYPALRHRALGTTRTTTTATDARARGYCGYWMQRGLRACVARVAHGGGSECLLVLLCRISPDAPCWLALLRARCLPPGIRSIDVLRLPDGIA